MFKSIVILFIVITTTKVQYQTEGQLVFSSEVELQTGDTCDTMYNGVKVIGVCSPISNCPLLLANVQRNLYNHTVCGYDDKIQIICCPNTTNNDVRASPKVSPKVNLSGDLKCQVVNSNQTGVIKYLSDCPEINKLDANEHVNKLCTDEICSDLVCCPVASASRLKNVCWIVDHPSDTLEMRLKLNLECTVKQLNIKGRYQRKCAYAERNPHLKSMLQSVCADRACDGWYCCPIEDGDVFDCTALNVLESIAIMVGPKCVDSKTGQKGTCKRKQNCKHYDAKLLDECGIFCCDSFYCCPDEYNPVNQTISARECNSYTKYLSKQEIEVPMNLYLNQTYCALVSPAGGVYVRPGEYPHMAALGYKPDDEVLWKCGGSLISNKFVLTAGHCLNDSTFGPVKKIRVGVIDLFDDINSGDCPEDFDVARLIPHPEYNPKFVYNDIGLIEMTKTVKFNFDIRPLCLPLNTNLGEYYVSMGWGATGPGEDGTDRLIKVDQVMFTFEECQNQYDVGRRYPKGINNETQICAGSRRNIQSTCPGDSGGPLVAVHHSISQLVYAYGIVSFGNPCGFRNSPGVYTNVMPYVNWIEAAVWKN